MLEDLLSKFPKSDFTELKKLPTDTGGSLVTKVSLSPEECFEALEVIYGPYNDLMKDAVFIDGKSTWERYFQTSEGILRVYDFKGGLSIGHSGLLTDGLASRASSLRQALEAFCRGFREIKPELVRAWIRDNPLVSFTHTFVATRMLLDRALSNESNLEALVLYASIIDAQLRFGIILSMQLRERRSDYDKNLVFQEGRAYVSERQIYKTALEEVVISDALFDKISSLYDFRNRAVHRYFISDFEYSDISNALDKYKVIHDTIGKKLKELEEAQVREGVGMTTKEHLELDDEQVKDMLGAGQRRIDSKRPIAIVPKRKQLFPEEEEY